MRSLSFLVTAMERSIALWLGSSLSHAMALVVEPQHCCSKNHLLRRWGWWSGERVGAGPCAHHVARSPRRHAEGERMSHGAHDQAASGVRGRVDDGVGGRGIHGGIL
ncbi:LOW QUALITY PROTEIN: hypothetical protein BDA96_06G055200 [Sorghum bicolor]|uniref:Secreted protein n=1 Tax=Sorghum bicolor TaxID=4558 RepID=A0A921QR71_SORBI|nr:LOW QUALITY PROTEIN: hypothetical protein BDA96_06G055200 [Sorghum bicolor]